MPAVIERLYLDAPSLTYRAFFALPRSIADAAGRPVNAVRGVMEMITRLLTDRRPAEVVAVFDDDYRPAFRVASYQGYKADRPADPPELPPQFEVLAEVLDAAGIRRVISPGLEADDALAALTTEVPPGEVAAVVTGDRDLFALVRDPKVVVLFTVRGVSELAVFDEGAGEAAHGVPPRLYPEYAILRGDPSDGLPGVAGIGPKRAAALLGAHGSIEGIYAHLDELPARQRAAFDQARAYIEAMRVVVPMTADAALESTARGEPDEAALQALAERYNLGSSAVRLARALRGAR